MPRIILHCDLDCFFASVEMRDNPEYRGKPVIIGADPKKGKGRGVISTCSYEAREFGLHSGMPISQAYSNCPHGVYLRPNGQKYKKVSREVMRILKNYANIYQKVGIDEAYLELTDICSNFKESKKIAEKIQVEIYEKVRITISIGISFTKSLAKIGSDLNKPNGISVLEPKHFKEKIKNLHITRIPGIGKKSKEYYYKEGIKTIGDIIKMPLPRFIELFGKHGEWAWKVANGLDNRKIKEFHEGRKSISAERTFLEDTDNFKYILSKLEDINHKIHKIILKNNIAYKTITLKIRFEGFETHTRSKTLPFPIQDLKKVMNVILKLYQEFLNKKKKIRLIGIKLSNFEKNPKVIQKEILSFIAS